MPKQTSNLPQHIKDIQERFDKEFKHDDDCQCDEYSVRGSCAMRHITDRHRAFLRSALLEIAEATREAGKVGKVNVAHDEGDLCYTNTNGSCYCFEEQKAHNACLSSIESKLDSFFKG